MAEKIWKKNERITKIETKLKKNCRRINKLKKRDFFQNQTIHAFKRAEKISNLL